MRTPIIAGNWKMHCTPAEGVALCRELLPLLPAAKAQILVCPPFTALSAVGTVLTGSEVMLGAQDCFWKEKGAYTGQIAPHMLREVGCRAVILGHSERRGRFGVPEPDFDAQILAHFGDSDRTVNRKIKAALAAGLLPICCVGETLAERQEGRTDIVVKRQTAIALEGLSAEQAAGLVFAYEPVWAIGTGEVCAAEEADRVCGVIRSAVGEHAAAAAESVRIQYGGSVKPDNAADLLARANIDGALVGGASLKAADFAAIVAAAG